jgi:hypothetical protein
VRAEVAEPQYTLQQVVWLIYQPTLVAGGAEYKTWEGGVNPETGEGLVVQRAGCRQTVACIMSVCSTCAVLLGTVGGVSVCTMW